MQSDKHLDNAVLIYFLFLISFVIISMFDGFCLFDIIYLIVLLCAVFRYLIIMNECRK